MVRTKTRRHRLRRLARMFVFVAYALVAVFTLQTGVIEVVAHHDDDHSGSCPDDDKGACDCGPNCHCCLACAHHGTPAVVTPAIAELAAWGDLVELGRPRELDTPSSIERGPPLKVPKHLA